MARKTEKMDDAGKNQYKFYAELRNMKAQFPVKGLPTIIDLSQYPYFLHKDWGDYQPLYLHIDLELPETIENTNLYLDVATFHGNYNDNICFTPEDINLYRDGQRLHFPPVDMAKLIDDECMQYADGVDNIIITLLFDKELNKEPYKVSIPIKGIPRLAKTEDPVLQELQSELNSFIGWDSFKKHVQGIIASYKVNNLRIHKKLESIAPKKHVVIMGNAGTGKTSAVKFLAKLYHFLDILKENKVVSVTLTDLLTSNVNTESEELKRALDNAWNGILLIENAHQLHNPDSRGNYNSEDRIVKALINLLENQKKANNWVLVLTGTPDGMASLMTANPELRKFFAEPIMLDDFKPDELCSMLDNYSSANDLILNQEAKKKLESFIMHKYNMRGPNFENARLIPQLFDNQIVPRMFHRIGLIRKPTEDELKTVLPEDIPTIQGQPDEAFQELENLVGLGKIKTRVRDYLNAVQLAARRMEMGLPTNMPRLHMAFMGNPGTGKTTVATIIGKVFASWGILSGGRVIETEKSKMVGQYIGETEFKMRELLAQARGNILFIDEAYQLVEGSEKDYGRIVMNSLLTELGKDNQDIVVILAGYTAPMKKLMESNEGIESRFPNVFSFEDYTTDELMEIGKLMIHKQGFKLTEGAATNMRAIIEEEAEKPSPRFGNGRFVSNLLQNQILASLGARTAALPHPTTEELNTILPEDVVINKAQKDVVFDDVAIDTALEKLDNLAGLTNVKIAIHNFVKSARYLHDIGEPYVGKGLLAWRFVGNSGTGKSTVAELMAVILKGMRLIANSHITEIKGERIFNVSEMDCDHVLREAVKKSCNGLIFIDVDTRGFSNDYNYARTIERIRLKMGELTVEAGGECALILAELDAPNKNVAEQLIDAGIYEFDHTLVFKDFTAEELYIILCDCLKKFNVTFSPAAEKHMLENLKAMRPSIGANARTMKLMSRTIYQQIILRESNLTRRPKSHQVQLSDIETFKWNGRKGTIGF